MTTSSARHGRGAGVGRGGRPPRGYERSFRVQLYPTQVAALDDLQKAGDTTYQDLLEALVTIGLRHLEELPEHLRPELTLIPTEEVQKAG